MAPAVGYVESDVLGGRLPSSGGVQPFVDAGEVNGEPVPHMLYRLWFTDAVGHPLTLTGFKNIHHPVDALSRFSDVWSEPTTLYTTILPATSRAEEDHAAAVIGRPIHIRPFAAADLPGSMQTETKNDDIQQAIALACLTDRGADPCLLADLPPRTRLAAAT